MAFTNLNIVNEKMKAMKRKVAERVRVSRAFSRLVGLGETKHLLQRTRGPPNEQSQFSPENLKD